MWNVCVEWSLLWVAENIVGKQLIFNSSKGKVSTDKSFKYTDLKIDMEIV